MFYHIIFERSDLNKNLSPQYFNQRLHQQIFAITRRLHLYSGTTYSWFLISNNHRTIFIPTQNKNLSDFCPRPDSYPRPDFHPRPDFRPRPEFHPRPDISKETGRRPVPHPRGTFLTRTGSNHRILHQMRHPKTMDATDQ